MTKKRKGSGEETASNSGTPKKITSESQFTAVGENTKTTNQQNKKNNDKNSNNKNTQNKTKSPNKQNSTNNTPNKNKKKNNNKPKSDPETKALTTALFSELTSEDTDVPFANPFLLPKEHEETAAWVDEDDDVLVSTRKQLRTEEVKVTGHEYQEKLRKRHKALAVQSDDWAKIKKKKSDKRGMLGEDFENDDDESDSDDDGDEILYRSQPLTMPSTRLITTSIDILPNPVVQQHQSGVRRVSIHPVEPVAMSVDGNTLKVYRLGEKMVLMHSVKMTDMDITDACFSIDGSQIFMCGNQPSLYILEVSSGKLSYLSKILGRKEKGFSRIYMSPNEKHCALLGNSGSIILISTLTKQYVGELRGPSNSVYCATFASDGRLFASYAGGSMIVWDINSRTAVHTFTNPSLSFATAIAISPDGNYLALGSNVGVVDVFLMKDLATGGPRQPTPKVSLDNLLTSISFIKFNHDSQLMAMGSDVKKQGLRLVHLPSFTVYQNWPIETTFALIKDVSFSPASGFLLTGENIGKVKMFRLPHFPAA